MNLNFDNKNNGQLEKDAAETLTEVKALVAELKSCSNYRALEITGEIKKREEFLLAIRTELDSRMDEMEHEEPSHAVQQEYDERYGVMESSGHMFI